jgi:hypothetical protein
MPNIPLINKRFQNTLRVVVYAKTGKLQAEFDLEINAVD